MTFDILVGGLQKFSTIDFPGRLACVLFLRGCNMDCFYCHNRELLCLQGVKLAEQDWLPFLQKRKGLLEGVVITGGEPLVQSKLPELLRYLQSLGYALKLDTNGLLPERLKAVLQEDLVDFVALDVKALPQDYAGVCSISDNSWENVQQSLRELLTWQTKVQEKDNYPKKSFEVRTTLYPGLNKERLIEMAKFLPVLPAWRLNFFRQPVFLPPDSRKDFFANPALELADLNGLKSVLEEIQPHVFW